MFSARSPITNAYVGLGSNLEKGGDGKGRHEHADKGEQLMGYLQIFHNASQQETGGRYRGGFLPPVRGPEH